jgi:hypothetical protein
MTRIRFATLKDLFASFSTAAIETGEEASAEESVAFVRRCLAEQRRDAAITYCAYLLPRREAVWWGCHAMRDMKELTASERACVAAARQWALRPDEAARRKALDLGLETSAKLSGGWIALAAAWSGGSIAPAGGPPMAPSPAATAQAVRVALLSASTRLANDRRPAIMTAWVEFALRSLDEGMDFA